MPLLSIIVKRQGVMSVNTYELVVVNVSVTITVYAGICRST